MSVTQNEYKSPKRLGLTIQILMVCIAALNIFGMFLRSTGEAMDGSQLKNIAALLNILGNGAELVVMPLALVELGLIVTWMRRTIRNLPALNAQGAKAKGWHAFMFIVPILNLFWPMLTLHEVWKASDPENLDAQNWKACAPSAAINTWWTLMLLGIGLSVPMQVHMLPDDLNTHLGIISMLFNLAFQLSFIFVIGNISSRQERKHTHLINHPTKQ